MRRLVAILAGNPSEARQYAKDHPAPEGTRYEVVTSATAVRGIIVDDVIRVGTWQARRGIAEIEKTLFYCRLRLP